MSNDSNTNNKGYVYILSNSATPGLFKIGASKVNGKQRAEQLYKSGVSQKFKLEFEILVDDVFDVERHVHFNLDKHRINKEREFFSVDMQTAIVAITGAAFNKMFGRDVYVGGPDLFMPLEDINVPKYLWIKNKKT